MQLLHAATTCGSATLRPYHMLMLMLCLLCLLLLLRLLWLLHPYLHSRWRLRVPQPHSPLRSATRDSLLRAISGLHEAPHRSVVCGLAVPGSVDLAALLLLLLLLEEPQARSGRGSRSAGRAVWRAGALRGVGPAGFACSVVLRLIKWVMNEKMVTTCRAWMNVPIM